MACAPSQGARLSLAGGSSVDAKISALMAEWGFTDRATAEAYYRWVVLRAKEGPAHNSSQPSCQQAAGSEENVLQQCTVGSNICLMPMLL